MVPTRKGVPTLIDIAARRVCNDIARFTHADIVALPYDLSQKIFSLLVDTRQITAGHLPLFVDTQLVAARLGSLPAVGDKWLYSIANHAASLQELDLANCRDVTDEGLLSMQGASELRTLKLDCCFQISDAGLAALEGMPRLTSLSCEACDLITGDGLVHLRGES